MSTRSVIAVAKGDGWEGVYCHSDGYPTWQGPALWATLHTQDHATWAAERLTAHPGGYSLYPERCYCHSPEYEDRPEMVYTDADADNSARFIQWVYVVGRHALTVFKSVPTGREQRCENDLGHWWMEPVYRWALVTQIDLAGQEPDWEEVEALGNRIQDEAAEGTEEARA